MCTQTILGPIIIMMYIMILWDINLDFRKSGGKYGIF